MTAVTKYRKLEARGLWRDLPEGQRREVVVNLGDQTLILTDPRSDTPLSHWSLPAVTRANPGEMPALYLPGEDATETLEIDDPDMIAALETVHAAIAKAQPRPGRLRGVMLGSALAGIAAVFVFWLPDALMRHTASVLPPATRAEIGRLALADITRIAGAPCTSAPGLAALDRLAQRLFGPKDTPRLVVMREGVAGAVPLPGNQIVLPESMLVVPDGPEVAAGHILAARLRAEAGDPVLELLRYAGPIATLRLLTTGVLPQDALTGHAEALLQAAPAPVPDEALLAAFSAAKVPSTPYAYALDQTGETTLGLIEADPMAGTTPDPLLPDADWVSLQDICTL